MMFKPDYELDGIDWKKVDFEDNQESLNLFEKDAQGAVNDLTGKWLGSRQIRCNWATKGVSTSDGKQGSDSKSVVELINGSSENVKEAANSDVPENNPQYTTVYVGNLAQEIDLHRHFHALGAGSIEEVRVQRDKGFGFVSVRTTNCYEQDGSSGYPSPSALPGATTSSEVTIDGDGCRCKPCYL
ncbi:hypothetical protein ACS0TY_008696 [Phlomoides rotata]